MKKYLVKKAYIKQEEFYSLELDGELVERVKNRINNYDNDFNLSDKEMELIDENVLAYCFTSSVNEEFYNALTDVQKVLIRKRKRDNGDFYDFANYIEEIINEFVWDVDCEYGDSEVDYCDNFIETYEGEIN
jgi:Zn-dependent M32 family carboxypeptidase